MITTKKNKHISDRVYKVSKGNEVEYEGIYNFDDRNEDLGRFKGLAVENNQNNGMQTMAVALVDNSGEVGLYKNLITK